jgi:hypothetical protein
VRNGTAATLAAALTAALLLAPGCTGVRVREFDRESYAPAPTAGPFDREFGNPPAAVRDALVAVLAARGLAVEAGPVAGETLRARIVWAGAEEAAAALDLGRLRRVTTRTRRTYRSYSLFDYDCNACVVRNGTVVGQESEVVRDEVVELDPARYRLEGWLSAELSAAPGGGTRLALRVEADVQPREPPDLLPRSRGHLEGELLEAVAARLAPSAGEVR